MRNRRLSAAIAAVLVAGLTLCWLAGSVMSRGQSSPVAATTKPATDFVIKTPDGLSIAATFRPGRSARSPAILLLHGVDASRATTASNAAWLARLGYATLAIDFRGHGQSSMAARSFGLNEALDARAAFDWLKRHQHGAPVAIIGISLGGAASLIGTAGPIPADALVLQAVYPDIRHAIRNRIAQRLTRGPAYLLEPLLSFQAPLRYGVWPSRLSPLDALQRYPGPVLVIGGIEDRSTPPDESRAMAAAAAGKHELWLVARGGHGEICALADDPYRRRVAAFLSRTIGAPTTE